VADILIGTSGWHYASWKGPFYPPGLRLKDRLTFYATQFRTAELNGVFYRTPSIETVKAWREQTPEGFVFAWKASKFITHWKRLSDHAQNSLDLLEERVSLLGDKAGPILFQLPPQFGINYERLASFIRMLRTNRQYAFEFRHPSWYVPRVLGLLSDKNIALCLSDHADAPSPWRPTADFVYIRGHGPDGQYKGRYSQATLQAWSQKIKNWRARGRDVFAYFDNDQKSAAPLDAERLMALSRATAPACNAKNATRDPRRVRNIGQ